MKILINEIWEKIHLTCLLLSGQGGSGKGQGEQEVTSHSDEVNSLYIRNSFKNPEKIFELLCPFLQKLGFDK